MTDPSGVTTWADVVGFIGDEALASVATASADGRPHVAVVSPGFEGELIWIATRAGSAKARNVRANPRLSLLWRPMAEVYVDGDVTVVDDPAEKARVWAEGGFRFDPATAFGTPDNPDLVFLRVVPTRAVVFARGEAGPEIHRWHAR